MQSHDQTIYKTRSNLTFHNSDNRIQLITVQCKFNKIAYNAFWAEEKRAPVFFFFHSGASVAFYYRNNIYRFGRMNALRGPEIELFAYDQNDSVNKCQ